MGEIRFRPDRGVYFIDYVDARGRRRREKIGSGEESKRLARRILAQREAEAVLGQHRIAPSETPRFGEYADGWLRRKKVQVRPKTIESYRSTVDTHLRPAFGEMRLGAIMRRDIETYLTAKRESGTRRGKKGTRAPLSTTTVNYTLHVLKFILRDAAEQGLLGEDPSARVKPLRSPDGDGKEHLYFLQPDEIARLVEAAEEPYATLYRMAVGTGMRRGELLGLRWRDLDLRRGLVHVRRTLGRVKDGDGYLVREAPLKTHHSRRTIDLSPSIVQALLEFPAGDEPDRDHVFRSRTGGPLDPDNLTRAFTRHLTTAGLPEVRFHDLRHTHASLLIAVGVHPKAIQARMGHANIQTTLNTYGHLMPSAFQGVGEQLDSFFHTIPAKDRSMIAVGQQ